MFRKLGATLAPAVLVAACGQNADEIDHEKFGASQAAITAGWLIHEHTIESDHGLENNLQKSFKIEAPDTARKFRIHFRSIDMERGYDFLVIKDQWNNELERITGRHRNYVSKTISGRHATITAETDYSVRSRGFFVDQIRHRGCERKAPAATPMRRARTCTDLNEAIQDLAVNQIRRRFNDGHFHPFPIPLARNAAAESQKSAPSHSETNVQVQGVDEADIVKTDGNFIYTIAGRQLRIFRSYPAGATELLHEVEIEGFPKGLFLDGNRVTVFSGVAGDNFMPGPIGPRPLMRFAPIWWQPDAYTKVTIVDAGAETPTVIGENLVAGQYVSARRVDQSVRLVLRRQLKWPSIQYYPNNVEAEDFDDAMDQLEADAVRIVTTRALSDWLPTSYKIVDGARIPLSIECTDFQIHSSGDTLGLTSVVTLNFARPEVSLQETSMLISARELYQSLDNLYIASDHVYSCNEDAGTEGQYTYVHKLDVSNPSRTDYLASGGFHGSVVDQFAFDEYEDHLRVAATINRWSLETPEERSFSRVYVLGQNRDRLEIVGQTRDLAPSERIFSSRFVEDKGFVVTYRQIDPLFTLDLSDPTDPRVLGELKIPGFSTYLHPLGEDHLFALGNDFDEEGRVRNGVALTIFDISDMATPRMIHKSVVGTSRGQSEALHEHKAFTMYYAPGDEDPVIAIPFSDWVANDEAEDYWGRFRSTLKVFRVSPRGILELGEVDHSGLFENNESNGWGWWYRPSVRRGVFVEDHVYALSDAGLRVAEILDPRNVVAEVAVEPQYANPTPPRRVVTETKEAELELRIPDNTPGGISHTLTLDDAMTIQSLSVELAITHTYSGDLVVTLEHNGVTETLHDRTGGPTDDIVRTFVTERFEGQQSQGDWTLTVSDNAGWDVGTVDLFKITANGYADGSEPTEPVRVSRVFENDQKQDIPDNDEAGISSRIEIPQSIEIERLKLVLSVRHSWRGDLRVTLEHDGQTITLHDGAGASEDDLELEVELDEFHGMDAAGTWTLKVSDSARYDTGTLSGWSLTVDGLQQ